MSNQSTMVVATKYLLIEAKSLKNGLYNPNGAKKEIHTKIVSRDYVNRRNEIPNNELYIIDEEATLEMIKMREESIKKQEIDKAKKAKEDVSNSQIVDALAGLAVKVSGKQTKSKKSKKEIETVEPEEVVDFSKMTPTELRAICDEKGLEYDDKAGKGKLIEILSV